MKLLASAFNYSKVACLCLGFLVSQLAFGHHSFVTHYDASKSMQLMGVVSEFDFRSPHSFVFMEAENEAGDLVSWEVEMHSKPTLSRMGLTQESLQPGDSITVIAWPNRVANNPLVFGIGLVTKDGTRIGQQPRVESVESVYIDANGVDRLQGRWQVQLEGAPTGHGSPMPLSDAGRVAVENYDAQKSPANTCEVVNIPTAFHIPYFFDLQINEDEVVIYYEIFNMRRVVPLGEVFAQSETTGMLGSARARIEGDELIIESRDYPVSGWGLAQAADANGLGVDIPSSVNKRMIERYSVSEDGLNLGVDYQLEDSVYLTDVYSSTASASRVSDDEVIYDYECEIDSGKSVV